VTRHGKIAAADGTGVSSLSALGSRARCALHRYRAILFVEKEGFDELFAAVQLSERYDVAIMSTKGMSVVAARALLDRLAPLVDHIFVLHDFDISGFSIFGTLGTDSRRYTFENDLSDKIIDIGLHLKDVAAMGLEAEPVEVRNRDARRDTLGRHGATEAEIEFLAPEDEDEPCQRIELNAMTSRQLVDFVEAAFMRYRVAKVIPDNAVIREHARHLIAEKFTEALIAQHAEDIAARATAVELPADLWDQLIKLVSEEPELSWDQALARLT
jgi:DNA topoisomerase VI subunit A